MADIKSTQTRPEFQHRFQAHDITTQRVGTTTATFTRKVPQHSSNDYVKILVGLLSAQEVRNV